MERTSSGEVMASEDAPLHDPQGQAAPAQGTPPSGSTASLQQALERLRLLSTNSVASSLDPPAPAAAVAAETEAPSTAPTDTPEAPHSTPEAADSAASANELPSSSVSEPEPDASADEGETAYWAETGAEVEPGPLLAPQQDPLAPHPGADPPSLLPAAVGDDPASHTSPTTSAHEEVAPDPEQASEVWFAGASGDGDAPSAPEHDASELSSPGTQAESSEAPLATLPEEAQPQEHVPHDLPEGGLTAGGPEGDAPHTSQLSDLPPAENSLQAQPGAGTEAAFTEISTGETLADRFARERAERGGEVHSSAASEPPSGPPPAQEQVTAPAESVQSEIAQPQPLTPPTPPLALTPVRVDQGGGFTAAAFMLAGAAMLGMFSYVIGPLGMLLAYIGQRRGAPQGRAAFAIASLATIVGSGLLMWGIFLNQNALRI